MLIISASLDYPKNYTESSQFSPLFTASHKTSKLTDRMQFIAFNAIKSTEWILHYPRDINSATNVTFQWQIEFFHFVSSPSDLKQAGGPTQECQRECF